MFSLWVLLLSVYWVNGVHFKITEGQKRCFIEEVPEETVIQATYKSLDHPMLATSNNHIAIEVLDPTGRSVMKREADDHGSFGFTSQMGGQYLICLQSVTDWTGTPRLFRFELAIEYGENTIDYTEIAQHEHLSAIAVEIRKLTDKVRQIRAEQGYQKSREEAFRNTSESTNARVMWFSIFQTSLLLLSGLWQINRLKNFFKQKKLV